EVVHLPGESALRAAPLTHALVDSLQSQAGDEQIRRGVVRDDDREHREVAQRHRLNVSHVPQDSAAVDPLPHPHALVEIDLAACTAQPSQETPTPTARPTSVRPKFELATYMYALQTKGKIRIAVLDKAIPFAVHDSSGLRTGFEVDLARELAKAIFGPQQDPD